MHPAVRTVGVSLAVAAVPDHADDPDAESEETDVIFRAMELIRPDVVPKTWTAFWRTVVDAAAPADVAIELSMSAPAVRMAKSRVLSRLRRELDGLVILKIDGDPACLAQVSGLFGAGLRPRRNIRP